MKKRKTLLERYAEATSKELLYYLERSSYARDNV